MTGTLWHLSAASVIFALAHMIPSHGKLRARLVAALGERPFQGLYSVLSLALIYWMIQAYGAAPEVELWSVPTGLRHLALAFMLAACLLLVAGILTPNPTLLVADCAKVAGQGPIGVLKITRHPIMWATGLWGVAHLLANGEAAVWIMFTTFTFLAIVGALHMDRRKRTSLGEVWTAYEAQTSSLPFAAVIRGRCRVSLAEIGYGRLAGGLALYAAMLYFHESVIGLSPFTY